MKYICTYIGDPRRGGMPPHKFTEYEADDGTVIRESNQINELKAFGIVFPKGEPMEILDPAIGEKLRNNTHFEVVVDEAQRVFSRDELESIAEDRGMSGLRVVGDPLGVKGVAKDDLIDKILGAQSGNDNGGSASQ